MAIKYGWQFDPEKWDQLPSGLINSDEWRYVLFSEAEALAVPAEVSGLYLICASIVGRPETFRDKSINDLFSCLYTPVYIGQTGNLRQRFLGHCNNPSEGVRAAKECYGASLQFWFHRWPTEKIKNDEALLIACFGPTANVKEERIRARIGKATKIGIKT